MVTMTHLDDTIRGFAAGNVSIEGLRFAAEQNPGVPGDRLLVLLLEFENSGPEFDEVELRRRATALLET
jgi:hypothetical protein